MTAITSSRMSVSGQSKVEAPEHVARRPNATQTLFITNVFGIQGVGTYEVSAAANKNVEVPEVATAAKPSARSVSSRSEKRARSSAPEKHRDRLTKVNQAHQGCSL